MSKPGKVRFDLSSSRRVFLKSLSRSALVLPLESVLALARPLHEKFAPNWLRDAPNPIPAPGANQTPAGDSNQGAAASSLYPPPPKEISVNFLNVAREAGLNAKTTYGGEHKNKYLLETTGCGVAFYDYDNDDWLDIFLVNGWRLEGFPKGREPISHLFKNNRDGTFT
ncbi:MAG: VCBS repeat-containing protein, partial [Candidatus Acidiferrum sp.]